MFNFVYIFLFNSNVLLNCSSKFVNTIVDT